MDHSLMKASWQRCLEALEANSDRLPLMQNLIAAYQEPARRYHTLQHLTECLALFETHRDLASQPGEVEIALWFHDAVYDPRGSDNEVKSAQWAAAELQNVGLSAERIARVTQLILATRHEALPQGRDQMLLVDIDLAILGAPRPRFLEYQAQIRAEYSWVSDNIFREKRSALLKNLLAREPLYNTPQLRAIFERTARDNLAHSLQLLDVHRKARRSRYGPCR